MDLLELIRPVKNYSPKKILDPKLSYAKNNTIILYYTKFDCGACVKMALDQLKLLKNTNKIKKI